MAMCVRVCVRVCMHVCSDDRVELSSYFNATAASPITAAAAAAAGKDAGGVSGVETVDGSLVPCCHELCSSTHQLTVTKHAATHNVVCFYVVYSDLTLPYLQGWVQ